MWDDGLNGRFCSQCFDHNKVAVIAKWRTFIMYSLSLLIVEPETARRRLLYDFEVPDGTPSIGLGAQPMPDWPCGRTDLSPDALPHALPLRIA